MCWRTSLARTTAWLIVVAAAPGAWRSSDAHASWFESLVMPDKVASPHASIEPACERCHAPFDKTAQDRLCLSCHSDVAADVNARRGYHGQTADVHGERCKTCHSDHHGRAAPLVRFDRRTFDHAVADFVPRGMHTLIACDECHRPGMRFRDAPSACADCHERTDPHRGNLGTACDTCHTERSWLSVRFDHGTTAFPLEGKHRGARCDGCHATKDFVSTPTTCAACHARDDTHQGSFGTNCQSCHAPRGWTGTPFDHLRRTQFPLVGAHARPRCGSCHGGGLPAERTPTECVACHARDDAHAGHFGRACETCHTPTEWRRPTFEHARRTGFPLRGQHASVRCTECHRGDLSEKIRDTSCYACHRHDDVHNGRQGVRCQSCHDETGWSRDVLFDHGTTPFPLLGAHQRLTCTQCHQTRNLKEVARDCIGCHQGDDVHEGKLGRDCERCHDASTFRAARTPHP